MDRRVKRFIRRGALLVAAAIALAPVGATAKQRVDMWTYCWSFQAVDGGAVITEVFHTRADSPGNTGAHWYAVDRLKQSWWKSEPAGQCATSLEGDDWQKDRAEWIAQYERDNPGKGMRVSSWRPPAEWSLATGAATPPPPVVQAAPRPSPPPPATPNLVVRSPEAEAAAAQRAADADAARRAAATDKALADIARSREAEARRQAEIAARAAAAQADYERKKREHEAALARSRAAQEEYRKKCEAVRAQGGSCVIER